MDFEAKEQRGIYLMSSILTKREIDCLYWTIQGFTSKEAARQLYITPDAIRYHKKSILKKSNSKIMTEAAIKLVRIEDNQLRRG